MRKKEFEFLLESYKDCRSEIKMRIEQRDKFSVQMIVAAGVIISLGLSNIKFAPFILFLFPLIALFYTCQILYSYEIHDRLHTYICKCLQPRIEDIIKVGNNEINWECYYESNKKTENVGRRKGFFILITLFSPIVAGVVFGIAAYSHKMFDCTIIIIIALTVSIILLIINIIAIMKFIKI